MKKTLVALVLALVMLLPVVALANEIEGRFFVPEWPDFTPVIPEIDAVDTVPATADNSMVVLYGALAVIGLAGAVIVRKAIAE